ncbi:MAG: hypothetical protein WCF65_08520 [Parachlamydiaceae bacterium]
MAMLKATVTIVGKRPILFHSFNVDSISLVKKERTGVAGNDPEEWKRSVLKTKDNQLYIDSTYVFGCLRDGGKHIKSGRGSIQAKITSTLVVLEETILLDRFLPSEAELSQDKDQPVYLDVRSVKNPSTKGRNVRYRIAASPGWKATFQIEWENTVVSRGEMQSAMVSAGSLVGLGDGRNIGQGRFIVEKFDVEEASEEPKKSKKK